MGRRKWDMTTDTDALAVREAHDLALKTVGTKKGNGMVRDVVRNLAAFIPIPFASLAVNIVFALYDLIELVAGWFSKLFESTEANKERKRERKEAQEDMQWIAHSIQQLFKEFDETCRGLHQQHENGEARCLINEKWLRNLKQIEKWLRKLMGGEHPTKKESKAAFKKALKNHHETRTKLTEFRGMVTEIRVDELKERLDHMANIQSHQMAEIEELRARKETSSSKFEELETQMQKMQQMQLISAMGQNAITAGPSMNPSVIYQKCESFQHNDTLEMLLDRTREAYTEMTMCRDTLIRVKDQYNVIYAVFLAIAATIDEKMQMANREGSNCLVMGDEVYGLLTSLNSVRLQTSQMYNSQLTQGERQEQENIRIGSARKNLESAHSRRDIKLAMREHQQHKESVQYEWEAAEQRLKDLEKAARQLGDAHSKDDIEAAIRNAKYISGCALIEELERADQSLRQIKDFVESLEDACRYCDVDQARDILEDAEPCQDRLGIRDEVQKVKEHYDEMARAEEYIANAFSDGICEWQIGYCLEKLDDLSKDGRSLKGTLHDFHSRLQDRTETNKLAERNHDAQDTIEGCTNAIDDYKNAEGDNIEKIDDLEHTRGILIQKRQRLRDAVLEGASIAKIKHALEQAGDVAHDNDSMDKAIDEAKKELEDLERIVDELKTASTRDTCKKVLQEVELKDNFTEECVYECQQRLQEYNDVYQRLKNAQNIAQLEEATSEADRLNLASGDSEMYSAISDANSKLNDCRYYQQKMETENDIWTLKYYIEESTKSCSGMMDSEIEEGKQRLRGLYTSQIRQCGRAPAGIRSVMQGLEEAKSAPWYMTFDTELLGFLKEMMAGSAYSMEVWEVQGIQEIVGEVMQSPWNLNLCDELTEMLKSFADTMQYQKSLDDKKEFAKILRDCMFSPWCREGSRAWMSVNEDAEKVEAWIEQTEVLALLSEADTIEMCEKAIERASKGNANWLQEQAGVYISCCSSKLGYFNTALTSLQEAAHIIELQRAIENIEEYVNVDKPDPQNSPNTHKLRLVENTEPCVSYNRCVTDLPIRIAAQQAFQSATSIEDLEFALNSTLLRFDEEEGHADARTRLTEMTECCNNLKDAMTLHALSNAINAAKDANSQMHNITGQFHFEFEQAEGRHEDRLVICDSLSNAVNAKDVPNLRHHLQKACHAHNGSSVLPGIEAEVEGYSQRLAGLHQEELSNARTFQAMTDALANLEASRCVSLGAIPEHEFEDAKARLVQYRREEMAESLRNADSIETCRAALEEATTVEAQYGGLSHEEAQYVSDAAKRLTLYSDALDEIQNAFTIAELEAAIAHCVELSQTSKLGLYSGSFAGVFQQKSDDCDERCTLNEKLHTANTAEACEAFLSNANLLPRFDEESGYLEASERVAALYKVANDLQKAVTIADLQSAVHAANDSTKDGNLGVQYHAADQRLAVRIPLATGLLEIDRIPDLRTCVLEALETMGLEQEVAAGQMKLTQLHQEDLQSAAASENIEQLHAAVAESDRSKQGALASEYTEKYDTDESAARACVKDLNIKWMAEASNIDDVGREDVMSIKTYYDALSQCIASVLRSKELGIIGFDAELQHAETIFHRLEVLCTLANALDKRQIQTCKDALKKSQGVDEVQEEAAKVTILLQKLEALKALAEVGSIETCQAALNQAELVAGIEDEVQAVQQRLVKYEVALELLRHAESHAELSYAKMRCDQLASFHNLSCHRGHKIGDLYAEVPNKLLAVDAAIEAYILHQTETTAIEGQAVSAYGNRTVLLGICEGRSCGFLFCCGREYIIRKTNKQTVKMTHVDDDGMLQFVPDDTAKRAARDKMEIALKAAKTVMQIETAISEWEQCSPLKYNGMNISNVDACALLDIANSTISAERERENQKERERVDDEKQHGVSYCSQAVYQPTPTHVPFSDDQADDEAVSPSSSMIEAGKSVGVPTSTETQNQIDNKHAI